MCLQWTSQQVAGWLYNLSVLINLNPMDCHHWQFFTRSVNYNLSIATMKHWPLWFLQSLLVASSFPSNPFCGGHVEVYTDVVLSLQTQWHDSEKRHEFKQGKNFSDLRFNFWPFKKGVRFLAVPSNLASHTNSASTQPKPREAISSFESLRLLPWYLPWLWRSADWSLPSLNIFRFKSFKSCISEDSLKGARNLMWLILREAVSSVPNLIWIAILRQSLSKTITGEFNCWTQSMTSIDFAETSQTPQALANFCLPLLLACISLY